jgi:ABC-type phosphate transport system substrate-binding protein
MFKNKGTSVISLVLLFALATASKPLVNALVISPGWAQSAATSEFPLPETVASGTTVRVDGSSSMAVFNQALQQGFEQKYPGTKVAIEQGGTLAALKSLQDGNVDLAAIGRPLTEEEKAQGLKALPIKREKIAVVVGTDNPFQGSLTDQQFAKIFRGEIKDWSEVGGAPGPIRFVDRPEDSDTRTAFQIYPVFKQGDFTSAADAVRVDADQTSDMAAKLGKDGISYAIVNQVRNLPGVRILPMHKTDADDPRYPFSQPLAYVYKGSAPSPATQAFLGFVSAPVGQQLIEAAKTAEAPAVASSPTSSPTATSSPESAPVAPTTPAVAESSGSIPPWLWLLLLPAIGIPLWLWLKNRRSQPVEVSARQPEIPVTVGSPPRSQGTSGVVSSDLTTRIGPVSGPAGATTASPTNVPESAEELSELLEDITESGKKENSTSSTGPAIAGAAALAAGAAGAIFSRQSEPAEPVSEPDVAEAVTQESPAYVPLEDSTVIQDDTVVLDTPQETPPQIRADTAEEPAIQWRSDEPLSAVDSDPQDSALDWLEPETPLVPFEDPLAPDEDDLLQEDPSVIAEAPTEEVDTDFNFLGGLSSLGGMAIAGGAAAAAAGAAAWSRLQDDAEPSQPEEPDEQQDVNRETETLDISEDLSGFFATPETPQTAEELPSLFENSDSSEDLSALLEDFPEEPTTLEDLPSLFDFPPSGTAESTEDQELSELAAMFDLEDQTDDAIVQPDVLLPEFPLSTEPLTSAMEFQESSQPEEDDFSFLFDDAEDAQAFVEPEETPEAAESQSLPSQEESDLWGLLEDLPGAGGAAIAGGAALGAGAMAWSSLDAEPDSADDEADVDLSALLSELGDFGDEDSLELADEDLSAIESALQSPSEEATTNQADQLVEAIDHAPAGVTDFAQGRVMAGEAALAAGAGVAAWSLASGDRAQESVEATKFDIGTSELPQEVLASVDEGLTDLPDGYGQSRIVLMPRDPQWAYAYWDVPNEHRQALRQQGGERLALRLYDATDIDLNYQRPHSLQQYECDELARDWYVPIPLSDRDYVIEIGYLTGDGNWLMLARSFPVRIPPTYPSDWFEEQFITVSWDEDLRGKTLLKLVPPSVRATASANPIYDQLFAMTQSTEAQRVAGSLFGSMQQVPEMTVSSFVFPSGAGMWALPTLSGINMSGIGFSASAPPIRPRNFWLIADAELIVYGATEPDATLTIGGRPIQLSPDGTFRFRMSFQDGLIDYPIMAVAADGEQNRSIHMKFTRETPQRNTNTKDQAIDEWPS